MMIKFGIWTWNLSLIIEMWWMHCVILLAFIIGDDMSSRGGDRAINTWFIPRFAGTEEVDWLEVSTEQ